MLKARELSGLKLITAKGLYTSEQENVHYCERIINTCWVNAVHDYNVPTHNSRLRETLRTGRHNSRLRETLRTGKHNSRLRETLRTGKHNFIPFFMNFTLPLPSEFSFDHCLSFLQRSSKEVLHHCMENNVRKLLRFEGKNVLLEIRPHTHVLEVTVLNSAVNDRLEHHLRQYIIEWFDLETDLGPFYAMAEKDKLLKDLIKKYYGYRIIGQPDLFESLVWAVLGQQINLQFAYALKQRFVEKFGERLSFEGHDYFLFPQPESVAVLTDGELLPLQFSRQKSRYTVLIAEAFASGRVSKEKLKGMSLIEAKEELMKIKGVGNWTANYALMKTFRYPDAFPLEDAGLHNAIRNLKNLKRKPTVDEVKKIFKRYKGWEAYATLYLWKSL